MYDGGIKEYQIFRNGKQVGTSATAIYKDTGLTGDTAYSYQVQVVGNNGLISSLSTALSVKTTVSGT